ncbi:MAG: response regulator transcription factor [Chitinophagaceae bacterium]|nr:response regulator transcription factor [Chitinophagaceae bacterium]
MMIRVVIADDHPEVRNAWAMFLGEQRNIQVVATCADGNETIKAIAEFHPDIVLMDINMKKTSGIETTRTITAEYPLVKVIAVSLHNSAFYIKKMIEAGAKGYVVKHHVADDLLQAITAVYEGKIYLGREAFEAMKK